MIAVGGEKIGTFYISYGLTLKIHDLIYSYLDYNIHFANFWDFTPCTGGLKMLKMLKNLNFQTYGRKGIYSLKCSSRGVEGYYIYFFWYYGSKPFKMAKIGKKLPYFQIWYFSAYFGHFEAFRAIISNKKLYSRLLLFETNVLSYISPFYDNFFNIFNIFRPPYRG